MLSPKKIIPLFVALMLLFLTSAPTVFAADDPPKGGNLLRGTSLADKCNPGKAADLIPCLKEVYKFGVTAVIILAVIVMMWGGLVWLTSGGNVSRVGDAKAWITGSVLGLFLALTSFIILNTINPQLTVLNITQPGIAGKDVGKCAANSQKPGIQCSDDPICGTPVVKGSCELPKTKEICCLPAGGGPPLWGSPIILGDNCENLPKKDGESATECVFSNDKCYAIPSSASCNHPMTELTEENEACKSFLQTYYKGKPIPPETACCCRQE